MMDLSAANTGVWLSRHGLDVGDAVFTELGGGVSNTVILVEVRNLRAVVKQSLGRLRVEQEWLSSRDRILREAEAMRWLSGRLTGGRVPAVYIDDPEEFAIAMEAAPRGVAMWKTVLFQGRADRDVARAAGNMLASMISVSWDDAKARSLFQDQTVFEELRIDPYYRFTAARHPEHAGYFHELIARSAARQVSLVHGDYSPKNLLSGSGELWAIDWEVVHFGDPSFDVAFLWNHLLLKRIAMPQHAAALGGLAMEFTDAVRMGLPAAANWVIEAAAEHLPALLLARVDGKSPAEYLDAGMRETARRMALSLMGRPAASIEEAFGR